MVVVCVCVLINVCVYASVMCPGAHGSQKRALEPLELELEVEETLVWWLLETECRPSGGSEGALHHGASSPARFRYTFKIICVDFIN